ncbi:MAG: hypothetical protein PHR15_00695 [Atopobiaceae bacterium]|jgi:uncharacterized protein (DUF697 family)|nr:hypothetical protein [Atopobiaceae bacterium]MCH4230117.1 hypothetical protein [Atopobiaceae bacterium]MCH4275658.1 hypothetical protein [Atopobiaceae bacterium]MCI1260290.1 hypothetical protein [Atopobiaceae bacterium]MDD3485324.1 hypothetical protein [Atopobiaceae bacterium]
MNAMPSFGNNLVGKALGVLDAGRSAESLRHEPVRIAIVLDPRASRDLVCSIRDAFVPEQPSGLVHVARLEEGASVAINPATDLAIVVVGPSANLCARAARSFSDAGIPCVLVAETSLDAPEITGSATGGRISLVVASSRAVLLDKLARWLCDTSEKDLALAACFPFVRHPKASQIIDTCSAENAGVAALPFLSGSADLPIMCANEAKMALQMAAVYGQDLSLWRIPEVIGVVAGGFGLRGAARQADLLLPGLGRLTSVGVGYVGTQAIGHALLSWFELASDPEALAELVSDLRAHVSHGAEVGGSAAEPARALID